MLKVACSGPGVSRTRNLLVTSPILYQLENCVQLNTLCCCLWGNVEASCYKHFVVFSRNQHRRSSDVSQLGSGRWLWSTGDRVDNTWHVAALTAGSKAIYRLRIAISAYPTCIRCSRYGGFPSEYCYAVWHRKTSMVWLLDCEKILMIGLFV